MIEQTELINRIRSMDRLSLFQKSTFDEVYGRPTFDRQSALIALETRAKDFGTDTAKQVKELAKAYADEIMNEIRGNSETGVKIDDFSYFDDSHSLKTGTWTASDQGGVYRETEHGVVRACYHAILPVERLRSIESGREKVHLAYLRNGRWHDVTVPKTMIASASKITGLAELGISVTSETAKPLVNYLSDIENLNNIPCIESTSKLGWVRDSFVPYDKDIQFDAESLFPDLYASLHSEGDESVWLDLMQRIRANKTHYEPMLYMAAAFASPLLKLFGALPFIVNLWGDTGKGKTVALMVAASIWGDPGEAKFITDSSSTNNALEVRLDTLNSLPMLVDDISKVSNKTGARFTDWIYLLCSGRGKSRSNIDLGLTRTRTWDCTILTNMERPLADETMKGGAVNRILDFQMADGYIFENGNETANILRANFGFAGEKFLKAVRDMDVSELKDRQRYYDKLIRDKAKAQGTEKEEKQIVPLSIMLVADEIAEKIVFHDGQRLDIDFCVSQLKDTGAVSEHVRAYEAIMDFINENYIAFEPDDNYHGRIFGGFDPNKEYAYINPLVMRRIAEESNFSIKAFCAWADKNNLIKKQASSGSRFQIVTTINKKPQRVYAIRMIEDIRSEPEGFVMVDEDPDFS